MNNLDHIIESVIDPTREGLDPRVFDLHRGEYHMKSYHRQQLKNIVSNIESMLPVLGWYVKGSILSKQWLDWTDIDIVVEIDPEISEEEINQIWDEIEDKYEGMTLAGTHHPIETFLIGGQYDQDRTEGLYDVENDQWVKGPYDLTVDINDYMPEFEEYAQNFDLALGELERDVTDYLVYQSISSDEVSALSDQIKHKVAEINKDIDYILSQRDEIKSARKASFNRAMTPDEIANYANKQGLPSNVIQKMLERYKYMKLSGQLRDLRKKSGDQESVNAGEVDQIKDILNLPSAFGVS
ncbi:hypothetical protein LCGC14_2343570 [marine sediment metagenome]|uniref:Polymerase nucleotidyl transferase domain-containing protein n=1 Tax=marine sediment metagenome TaxID=412755 RepID=A0A0F9CB67_9ZZZZ